MKIDDFRFEVMSIHKTRRYKTTENKKYHEIFERRKAGSPILNQAHMRHPSMMLDTSSEGGLLALKMEIAGGKKMPGYYYNPNTNLYLESFLLVCEQRNEEILGELYNYRQKAINQGYTVPEDVPDAIIEKKLIAEAYWDVYILELRFIDEKLKKFDDARKKEEKQIIINSGPCNNEIVKNGVLIEIGGMKVNPGPDGQLIIDDSKSKYDGILVADLRKFVNEWKINRPKTEGGRKKPIESRDEWPDVPEGIKNHKALKRSKKTVID